MLATLEAKRKEVSVRDMDKYREIIMENIDYDILLWICLRPRPLEEILELIVIPSAPTRNISVCWYGLPCGGCPFKASQTGFEHIKFVFSCLQENTTKIRNIKQYLLTTLYNAPLPSAITTRLWFSTICTATLVIKHGSIFMPWKGGSILKIFIYHRVRPP